MNGAGSTEQVYNHKFRPCDYREICGICLYFLLLSDSFLPCPPYMKIINESQCFQPSLFLWREQTIFFKQFCLFCPTASSRPSCYYYSLWFSKWALFELCLQHGTLLEFWLTHYVNISTQETYKLLAGKRQGPVLASPCYWHSALYLMLLKILMLTNQVGYFLKGDITFNSKMWL